MKVSNSRTYDVFCVELAISYGSLGVNVEKSLQYLQSDFFIFINNSGTVVFLN